MFVILYFEKENFYKVMNILYYLHYHYTFIVVFDYLMFCYKTHSIKIHYVIYYEIITL